MGSGVIAASRDASMSVPVFRPGSGTIEVASVLAPTDGWLVVRSTAPTSGVLGFTAVRKGENRDVVVPLKAIDGRQVRVQLFSDRGERGSLEFDPTRPSSALDKPILVGGAPVGFPLTLTGWGAAAIPNSVLLLVEDQKAGPTLEINYLLVPAQSWIEVGRVVKGIPSQRIGLLMRPAGEFQRLQVPIQGARPNQELVVTVFADKGVLGRFEPGTDNPLLGVDQPWVSAGVIASQRIRLR
jgi:hypothetical protein